MLAHLDGLKIIPQSAAQRFRIHKSCMYISYSIGPPYGWYGWNDRVDNHQQTADSECLGGHGMGGLLIYIVSSRWVLGLWPGVCRIGSSLLRTMVPRPQLTTCLMRT